MKDALCVLHAGIKVVHFYPPLINTFSRDVHEVTNKNNLLIEHCVHELL